MIEKKSLVDKKIGEQNFSMKTKFMLIILEPNVVLTPNQAVSSSLSVISMDHEGTLAGRYLARVP